mgnify:CR=1 FL=1
MKQKNNLLNQMIRISFVLYIFLLTWIIVFKFRIDIRNLRYLRTINLIPFKENALKEILINIFLFIPYGMYLRKLTKKKSLTVGIIILTSFIFEVLQYILHIGISDITDVMMNTLGGMVGILLISILEKKRENSKGLDNSIKYLLSIIPFIMIFLLFLL